MSSAKALLGIAEAGPGWAAWARPWAGLEAPGLLGCWLKWLGRWLWRAGGCGWLSWACLNGSLVAGPDASLQKRSCFSGRRRLFLVSFMLSAGCEKGDLSAHWPPWGRGEFQRISRLSPEPHVSQIFCTWILFCGTLIGVQGASC